MMTTVIHNAQHTAAKYLYYNKTYERLRFSGIDFMVQFNLIQEQKYT